MSNWIIILILLVVGIGFYAISVFLFEEKVVSGLSTNKRIRNIVEEGKTTKTDKPKETIDSTVRRKKIEKQLDTLAALREKGKVSMETRIHRAGLKASPILMLAIGCVLGIIVFLTFVFFGLAILYAVIPAVLVGYLSPYIILNFLQNRRVESFNREFPNAVDIIVRGVKAGLPIGECLQIVAEESKPPVGEEFEHIVSGQKLGLALEDVFDRAMDRMPSQYFRYFIIVIKINQTVGGALSEALENLSQLLRGRIFLAEKAKTASTETKASMYVLTATPFLFILIFSIARPGFYDPMLETETGRTLSGVAALFMIVGFTVMSKLAKIKI